MKTVYVIAGPNGSGKTTFAETYFTEQIECFNFINADLIAKGLSPLRPENSKIEAGRILFRKIDEFADRAETFVFESTLSGIGHVRRITALRERGYRVVIFYLRLASPELAIERVKNRVAEGGHSIPKVDLRRRFTRSWDHFNTHYKPLADKWIVFDNSGQIPVILEES